MKRINKMNWFATDKKGHEAIRLILNKKAMEEMGFNKENNNEVMVDYDFKTKRIIITSVNSNEDDK